MDNNLKKIEKDLRAFAKRCKDIKYTQILLFVFLLTGLLSLAAPADSVETAKRDLNTSITDMKKLFKEAKQENNKLMKGSNLELVQLMEQGDHVVKSPWSSWQYGMNYFYGDWTGTYKGRGDKKEKYPYEGILTRDENEFNRYVAPNSSMYSSLETSTNARSASTNSRKGLNNYGLASNRMQQEPIVSLEVNAGITPRVINKKSPDTSPAAPEVTLPAFEPKLITPPVPPEKPDEPIIAIPTLSVKVVSSGNGTTNTIDGNPGNGVIEMVAVTAGDFKVKRNTGDKWEYSYTGYSGVNAFPRNNPTPTSPNLGEATTTNPAYSAVAAGGTWTNWSRATTTKNSGKGFQLIVGDGSKGTAFLSNGKFLYTRESEGGSNLGEFAHLDVHGADTIANQRAGFVTATNGLANASTILDAYDDVTSIAGTGSQGTFTSTNMHTWLNSGKIILEGGDVSVTNTYTHNYQGTAWKQAAINTGEIIFQPYKTAAGQEYKKFTAGFVVSDNAYTPNHNVMYNGVTGKIKSYTLSGVGYVFDASIAKPLTAVNRGEMQFYGEGSAGIYIKRKANTNLQFVTKDFAFNTITNEVTAGSFKPVEIFGDKSIGFYQFATGGTAEGNFAVNIGAEGKGNENFSTAAVSNLTAGTNITDLNINPTNGTNTNIQGSFGILSNDKIDLTSHQIKIFDKTEGNVGVYPNANVALNIGGGSIELNGGTGTTSKNNIGIYINGKGSVKSTGDIKVNGGVGNLAIYAVGGQIPASVANHVEVKEVKANDTKNSVLIYGSTGAKVKLSDGTGLPTGATYGLNISGATVEADASTTNKKDSGAAFAIDAGTVITIDRTSTPTTANIDITGTKLTDADRYAGFGLMAKDGGKISAKNNYVKVSNGSTGVASIGSNANVDMTGGTVEYKGNGYALYAANTGTINMTNAKLILDGNAIGYEKVYGSPLPITTTNMSIHIKSKDVTVLSLKNATAPLNVSSLSTTLNGWAGLSATPTHDAGAENYKMAAIDGLIAYNIDQDIDKKAVAAGTADANSNMYVRNLLVQRANVNLAASKNVTAYLNTADLNSLDTSTVVGLDMNSSANAFGRSDTQINLAAGSSVNADRVDTGSGAVGLFINYGEANIASGAKVNVEKSGLNDANAKAVGVYAVNGSTVNNEGEINVGGEGSIGVLGISYRKDSNGVLKRDEFGVKPNAGDVGVVNKGKIELDGKKAVGIYIENNDSNKTATHTIEATNEANGVITMSGKKGIGMASKLGNLVNKGAINITADKGTGMFVETDGVRAATMTNDSTGTISIGDSTSESVLRTGMFTKNQNVKIINKGKIDAGKNSYAIYGKDVQLTSGSELNVGDNGVGIFSTSTTPATPNIDIQAGAKINLGKNEAVGVFLGTDAATGVQANGVRINDAGSIMNIGDNSYGYVLKGVGTTFTNSNTGSVTLGEKSVYLYSDDTTGNITNNVALTSNGSVAGTPIASATGGQNYGLYSAGTVVNNANIDFSRGIGNVGIYSIKGGTATNNATISVGASYKDPDDSSKSRYSIGMAAGFIGDAKTPAYSGNIVNEGTINVTGKHSIGMYGVGSKTTVYNGTSKGSTSRINLGAEGTVGIYLDKGAKGWNYGTITTVGNPDKATGVVVRDGAEFTNEGTIDINSAGGFAFVKANGGIIKNYGTFNISGGATKESTPGLTDTGKIVGGIEIDAKPGVEEATIKDPSGKIVKPTLVPMLTNNRATPSLSSIGMYIDTLRGTNPINGLGALKLDKADLIVGNEAAQKTTDKYIEVDQRILGPYNKVIKDNPQIKEWGIYSGAFTWIATGTINKNTGLINKLYMAKIPYTKFAGNKATPVEATDTYNFLNGLEQRYGVEGIGTRENGVFQKLNSIGKNEGILFYQAVDEMMGHQYANTQQRIHATGQVLSKEFDYLRNEWQTFSKDSNKVKVFGTTGEYKTDTAGVIDYKNYAYGVAYVHEDETVRLGKTLGWYTGIVHNTFKFKDIGRSKEEQLQAKLGVFKSVPFDYNNSLNWTISGEVFAGYNKMHRKFLVVDEIFNAKSKYYTYGLGIKNELSKSFRLSEDFTFKPYASLNAEYGRMSKIREKSGEIKLEVKSNDYFSVRPEIGAELGYKHQFDRKTLRVGVAVAYENELGRIANGRNKARVADTTADWFNIRGEKEDRRGNVKFDLNLGLDNQRYGVTANVGYDTKGENVRGGLGLRVIF